MKSFIIANRLKSVLDTIMSEMQTGFLNKRFNCENACLIYDILHFTEEKSILGLLVLIDFEKFWTPCHGISYMSWD